MECEHYNRCPLKVFSEQGRLDLKWIREYCLGDQRHCVRKKVHESGGHNPDNMLPDGSHDKSLAR